MYNSKRLDDFRKICKEKGICGKCGIREICYERSIISCELCLNKAADREQAKRDGNFISQRTLKPINKDNKWFCYFCDKWFEDHNKIYGSRVRCKRCASLYLKYKIYGKDYDLLLKKQDNKCAICRVSILDLQQENFYVDHNHMTKKIRGLLCNACNLAEGILKNKNISLSEWGRLAEEYINKN